LNGTERTDDYFAMAQPRVIMIHVNNQEIS